MKTKEEYYDFFINKGNSGVKLMYNSVHKHFPELGKEIDKQNYIFCKKYSEEVYCYLKDVKEQPKCLCGNLLRFKQFSYGYFDYCSTKCSASSEKKKGQIAITNKKKYGHENIAQGTLKDKIQKIKIKRYGGLFTDSPILKKRCEKTHLKKYGVKHFWGSKLGQDKRKQSLRRIYGVENPMQHKETLQKQLNTKKERGYIYKYTYTEKTNLEEYKRLVYYYTNITYRKYYYLINPERLKRSKTQYHIDHIYPKIEGWKNKIDPKDMAHFKNLRILWCKDNHSKGCKTNMTLEEFYKLIEKDILKTKQYDGSN